jgi:putative MATE family efflux protein
VLGLIFGKSVLTLMNTPAESFDMAVDYVLVCSIGVLFSYGYNMVSAVLRGMGDSRHPFIFVMIASVINIILDLLFVGVFRWSVAGAAWATILGQAFSFIYAIFYLYRNKENFGFDFKLKSYKLDPEMVRQLSKLGIPFAVQSAAINISMMFVNSLVNTVGVYASAVFGVGIKVDDIVNKVTQGVTYAASSMVGQNIAAGEQKRVQKTLHTSWLICGVCYLIFAIALVSAVEPIFSLFTSDPEVIELAPVFVKAILWNFPAMVIMKGTNGLVQGIGNARLSLIFGLLDAIVFRIGLAWLCGIVLGMGLYGFFLGFSFAAYGTAIPGLIYYLSGRWKNYAIVHK